MTPTPEDRMSTKTEEVHERAHDDDRPLPSARMDAAAERLKAEKPEPVKAKRTKAPTYYVLMELDGRYELLTPEPVAASSRKEAVRGLDAPGTEPRVGTFLVILADQWQTVTRTVKPRQDYEELWS